MDDDLEKIQLLRNTLVEIISTVGELHLSKIVLQKELVQLDDKLNQQNTDFFTFQEQERVLYEEMQQKYGTGEIDIQTGEIKE